MLIVNMGIASEFGVSPEIARSEFISLKTYVKREENDNGQKKKWKWRRGSRKYVVRMQPPEVPVEQECI
jgi:hypothetical protein